MNTQEKKSLTFQNAVVTLNSPYEVIYSIDGKNLSIDVAIHSILDKRPNALVYFPLHPKWEAPFENDKISAQETDVICDCTESALQQMGFNVKFCIPMGYNA